MASWREALHRIPAERVQPSAMGRGWGLASAALTRAAMGIVAGVLVKCYPKASAPVAGLVNRITNVILIDGELLGCDPQEIASEPDAEQRSALMVLLGVLFHECGHVRHTPTPEAMAAIPEELIEDAKLLEEGRMEARLGESHPRCLSYLRAAVAEILLEHRPAEATEPMGRARAVRQAALVLSRVPAGTLTAADVAPIEAQFAEILAEADLEEVREIVAEVCAAADEEAVEALTRGARRLQELAPPEEEADGPGGGDADGARPSWSSVRAAVADLARRHREEAVSREEREGAIDPELRAMARAIAEGGRSAAARLGLFGGHGLGLGPGIPPSGGRPPVAIEVRAARNLATALREARSRRLVREGRIAPPGRFSGRGAMRQASEIARGAPVRGLAFRTRRTVVAELWHPLIGIAVDVSGSMSPYEGAIASVLWVCHSAVEQVGGRAAASLFGDEAVLLCAPGRRMAQVPVVSAVGGAEDVGEGIEVLRAALPLGDRRRPRLLVLIGDGQWVNASWARAGERNIAELRAAGCGVVSVGIGAEPVAHGESRRVAVAEPLEIAAVIGRACVGALGTR